MTWMAGPSPAMNGEVWSTLHDGLAVRQAGEGGVDR
jgi:hypothetical protein